MWLVVLTTAGFAAPTFGADPPAEKPYGIPKRTPWTASRIRGTPEPPPPYRLEPAFPKLKFKDPLDLTMAPGMDRFFVVEQKSKIYSFRNDSHCDKTEVFFDLTAELNSWDANKVGGVGETYALTFHPQFAKNRFCYICYIVNGKGRDPLPDGTRVSRFRVTDTDPPRVDPKSEQIVITWLSGGHNGCCLKFGPDGYLYISTGDATSPNPPDALDTGQDVSDLLGAILRIDVDRTDGDKAYAIPPDNPFVKSPKTRPEIWSYGFRNPWRMSFDRATGDLWVGDVGWELWEMVYRIQKGGNYGWSVMEGRQPVKPNGRRGPTPILPPTIDFPHTEAGSITGGYVYRGKRFKDLIGTYVCGDWLTGKYWSTRFDGDRIVSHREIAVGTQRIVGFAEDHAGELYLLDYSPNGGIYRFEPNQADPGAHLRFPRKLSETGLFASVAKHEPAPGVVPFSVNAEQWADFATAERLVALPGESSVVIRDNAVGLPPDNFYRAWVFLPKDGVLAKTISLEMERGNPQSRRRLETQILHFDGAEWQTYGYQWNDEQTDAVLVPSGGADRTFTIKDSQAPGGVRQQTWHFASRNECRTCHNTWVNNTLSFNLAQLNRDHRYGDVVDNQLRTLIHAGIIERNGNRPPPKHADPYDRSADINARARSYLHLNCAHCHTFGAGGTTNLQLSFQPALADMRVVDVPPVQGTFDMADARIVASGDPYRSVLYYRMAKLGRGRMPHIGSEFVDDHGRRLVHEWISKLPPKEVQKSSADPLAALTDEANRAAALERMLATTGEALKLADAIAEQRLPESIRKQAVAAGAARPETQIRDLFERFLPADQRIARLGASIKVEDLLALKGDAARGKALFFNKSATQCATCHRVGNEGSTLGPDLSQVGKKYTRNQILDNIIDPSKDIDPKFLTFVAETVEGQLHTGVLADKTDQEVVLRDAQDKEIRLPAAKVTGLLSQKKSLMPEQLLRDLTAQQAADLLEYLASLK